jgi:hypothetical protein
MSLRERLGLTSTYCWWMRTFWVGSAAGESPAAEVQAVGAIGMKATVGYAACACRVPPTRQKPPAKSESLAGTQNELLECINVLMRF